MSEEYRQSTQSRELGEGLPRPSTLRVDSVPELPRIRNQEYVDFLIQQNYSHWFTLTTHYELTLKSARKLCDRVLSNWYVLGMQRAFWVAEKFKNRSGYHVHGMMMSDLKGGMNPRLYRRYLDAYKKATGVTYKVKADAVYGSPEPFRDLYKEVEEHSWHRIEIKRLTTTALHQSAHAYVSKYVNKGVKADYDFFNRGLI